MEIRYTLLSPGAKAPAYATPGAAAAALFAVLEGPLALPPGGRALVDTGVAIELPGPDWVALVCARSGLAVKAGLTLSNGVGVIDPDYRGSIRVGLVNLGEKEYTLTPGERVAQLLVLPAARCDFIFAPALGCTGRGAGGFGSTGRL